MGFDLASVLKDAGAQMGTGKERLEYIDIGLIDEDPNNFYALSNIDELCANIELVGLQQPVRLRPNPDKPGRYVIVSGHRRWTAFKKLSGEGKEQYRTIPAIIEAGAASAEMQELRLIYANSGTRKMTDFELRQQAERVQDLLYRLKEQGVDFPGRMRDHVAEACRISKSKLARLQQIEKGLAKDIAKTYYETGLLTEATALALSRLPVADQLVIVDRATVKKREDIRRLYESTVSQQGEDLARWREMECPACAGEHCINVVGLRDKLYSQTWRGYVHCGSGCCHDCPDLASCSHSCLRMQQAKQAAKAELKADKTAKRAEVEAQNSATIHEIKRLWQRMDAACKAQGKDFLKICADCKLIGISFSAPAYLDGKLIDSIATPTPFGYGLDAGAIATMVNIADALDVSLDYLLGRTDNMRMSEEGENDT